MKKLLVYAGLLLFVVSCGTKSDNKYAGTKTPYSFQQVEYTVPPDGYCPFYLDYTGRHGSRYMGDPTDVQMAEILLLAEDAEQLTAKGKQLLDNIQLFILLNKGNYGLLTDLGKQELQEIGKRALNQYSDVFNGGALKVLTTEKERTVQSARAFLSSYAGLYDKITISQEPDTAQTTLRFFDYSDEYNSYRKSSYVTAVVDSIRGMKDNKRHAKNVLQKIFENDFIEQLDAGVVLSGGTTCDVVQTAVMAYNLYTAIFSLQQEAKNELLAGYQYFFTEEELQWFDRATSCRGYMTIGPGFDINGIQARVAAPLLINILKTADSVVNGKQLDAYLKFGHAETTTPLATLMEIEGANKAASSILNFASYWCAENIATMAANIQLVLYKSREIENPVLVKVLLNEQEVRIPVKTEQYPYYKWEDVKAYYCNKLAELGIDIDMKPTDILKSLR